jgi:hypothetical protein
MTAGRRAGQTVCQFALYDCPTPSNDVDKQHHQRQYQQDMYEPTNRVATYHAEQPQHQKNYKNRPKHFFFLLLSTTPKFRWYKSNRPCWSNGHAVSVSQIFKQIARQDRMKTWHR